MDSDRSDRQQVNSRKQQATYLMRAPSPPGWSPAARLLSGPGHSSDSAPTRPFIGVQSAPPPIRHRARHNIGTQSMNE